MKGIFPGLCKFLLLTFLIKTLCVLTKDFLTQEICKRVVERMRSLVSCMLLYLTKHSDFLL